MSTLFSNLCSRPLADRLRPAELSAVVGQEHILSAEGTLGLMLKEGRLGSVILWGPPGCGKTTIAKLIAKNTSMAFEPVSAVFSGVAELRKVFEQARKRREQGVQTLLFVDEIHRFNRSQQDSFLPYVEDGTVVLVGATTENPGFELNSALLSRCQVLVLKALGTDALEALIKRAEDELGQPLPLDSDARSTLVALANGDGRYLLNLIEALPRNGSELGAEEVKRLLHKKTPLYDKNQENHYNLVSALHKSIRASDPDAALFWFSRMIEGGEDPRYLGRRLIRVASEDIGLAEPDALRNVIATVEAYERLGSPEGELALAQAVVYLATCPKSVAVYRAFGSSRKYAREHSAESPPMHSLNAPTKLMKELGYGAGYQYDPDGFSGANYFPDGVERKVFYEPTKKGFEREIKKRVDYWSALRSEIEEKKTKSAG